jgi:hypothetical protein
MAYYRRWAKKQWSAEDKAFFNARDAARAKGLDLSRLTWDAQNSSVKTSEVFSPNQTEVSRFDNLTEFTKACSGFSFGGSWYGGETDASVKQKAVCGDSAALASAEATEREFLDQIDLGLMLPRYDLSAVGAFPCVASALTGVPESMYRRTNPIDDTRTVKIYFVVTSSGGIDSETLEKRGIAACALYMAISQIRPCELYAVSGLSGGRGKIVVIKLETPINLSQCAFVLSNQGFARGLTYTFLQKKMNSGGQWPECWAYIYSSHADRCASIRASVGADPEDIVFPHSGLYDLDLSDPIGFCKGILNEYKILKDE